MSKPIALTWSPRQAPQELHSILRTLSGHYPIIEAGKGLAVEFVPDADKGSVSVELSADKALIRYDKPNQALRGVGTLLSGLVRRDQSHTERLAFETFGIMLDCSRNAVITVEAFKGWLRQLALLGYNMAMLYTEDTYELGGEEYFGYLRGRYTQQELADVEQYAQSLGIEMVGCIQTLGHLEQILRWPAYRSVRDTSSVLLVDEPATYELIDKMVGHFARTFRSRRILVGQDEAHDLGLGNFLDIHGYQKQFDIFNRHLGKVVEICRRHGLEPMIWSDMYFRMCSKDHSYYHKDTHITPEVAAHIPPEARLVYWDYYHDDKNFYLDWIGRHREIGHEPAMASGVWTWQSLWYDRVRTESFALPCVAASREAGLKDFWFTLWGDDGAYCELDSAMAGLAYGADGAYGGEKIDEAALAKRFAAVCGSDYRAVRAASDVNFPFVDALWDDPILGILWKDRKLRDAKTWDKSITRHKALIKKLRPVAKVTQPVDFAHALAIAEVLLAKAELHKALDKAYPRRVRPALAALRRQIPGIMRKIDVLAESFRRQWYRRNKPQGFEVVQIRLAGLKARYAELSMRLADLLAGKIDSIPELDEIPTKPGLNWRYKNLASGSVSL